MESDTPDRSRQMLEIDGWNATPDDDPRATLQVYCPGRAQFVTLRECGGCHRLHGMLIEPQGRRSFVVCDPPNEQSTRSEISAPPTEPPTTTVGAIMQHFVLWVHEAAPATEVLWLLIDRNISGVPVVNQEGQPVGIVSKTDLLAKVYRDWIARVEEGKRFDGPTGLENVTASEVMSPFVFALPEDAPVVRAAALMVQESVHRVPILRSDGRMIGLLSSMDLLQWTAERAGTLQVTDAYQADAGPPPRS